MLPHGQLHLRIIAELEVVRHRYTFSVNERKQAMWIRRDSKEIATIESVHKNARFNPLIPFLIASAFGCFDSAMHWAGYRGKFEGWGDAIPFQEAVWRFPFAFLFLFPFAYGYRIFRQQTPPQDGTLICTHCFEVTGHDSPVQCKCGGVREPFYFWRWKSGGKPTDTNGRDA